MSTEWLAMVGKRIVAKLRTDSDQIKQLQEIVKETNMKLTVLFRRHKSLAQTLSLINGAFKAKALTLEDIFVIKSMIVARVS